MTGTTHTRRPSDRSLSKILLIAFLAVVFPATAFAAEPILDRVLRTKKVKVGVCFHMPPFGYIDEQGKWTGYEMELTREIVRRLGVEGEWERITPVTRGPLLQAGRIDFAACAISQTRSREEVFDYTVWHFEEGKRMLAPKAKGYKALKDFVGKPIAVQQGSSAGPGLQDYFKKQGWPAPNLITFPDNPTAFLGIKQGKAEGYSQDQAISIFVSKADPEFEFVGEYYQRTRYGFGVPHDNSKWRDRLNFALNDMFADGTFMKIYDDWFHPRTGKVPLPENVRESVRLLTDMPWPE